MPFSRQVSFSFDVGYRLFALGPSASWCYMLLEDYEEIYGKNQALEKWCIELEEIGGENQALEKLCIELVPNKNEKKRQRKVVLLRKVTDGPREVLLPIHAMTTRSGEGVTCVDAGTGEVLLPH